MKKELFGMVDGKEVFRYLLAGDGVNVGVIDYGAAVQSILAVSYTHLTLPTNSLV